MHRHPDNPWLEIQGMKQRMDKLMDEVRERFDLEKEASGKLALWQPATDAYETESEYVIQMELPGLSREEISLEVKGKELWVSGERRMIKEATGSNYHILERCYGPFARKFKLPEEVDQNRVQASFVHGLLSISMPKVAKRPKYQKIKVTNE
ncbi:MAG: Hsp20/alpha crystallin family protein [Desulfohalobiaceae bacterium]